MKKTKILLFFMSCGMAIILFHTYAAAAEPVAVEKSGSSEATVQPTTAPDTASKPAAATPGPAGQAAAGQTAAVTTTQIQAGMSTPEPVREAATAVTEEKVNKIEIDNTASPEEEGIVIFNPGETSTEELEKYIVSGIVRMMRYPRTGTTNWRVIPVFPEVDSM